MNTGAVSEGQMMLRLHHSPMACSLAARLALLQSGLDFDLRFVRIHEGENRSEAYLAVNPLGQVPTLTTSNGTLTQLIAILQYIADLVPERELLPPVSGFARAEAIAKLSFLSTSLHPAFRHVVRPAEGCDNDAARTAALGRLNGVLSHLDAEMVGRDTVLPQASLCDTFLLVLLCWRRVPGLAAQLVDLPELDRFERNALADPKVADVIKEEMTMLFGEANG